MEYFIGALMGYFVGTNALVEKQVRRFVGYGYSNQVMGLLSSLGGLGGWFCIIPAAYFVGSDYGNGFLEGLYFVLAVISGAFASGILQIPGLNYLLSALTLFVNIGLAIAVYSIT
ncbi:hypothetical protein PY199_003591 [Vibrio cholerae]|uniref:hypothetical protein n=1 Tax=Vibrio cholerae TaxID=666 RepID=UPI000E0A0502|nr:hypothetical protein [Vibrio cholerae]EGR4459406.1 hypothetical protein [Vibrio cholerae]EKN8283780.1 hypothetical protein [Vibrio cholerae]GHW72777.1 hypothetical protein VCSRO58_3475 [Vibrio cholerae]